MNLEDYDEELMTMDDYDDCIVGVVERFGQPYIVCYDKDKVLAKLSRDMTYEEAVEFFEFNMVGAFVGETTPCFITKFESNDA